MIRDASGCPGSEPLCPCLAVRTQLHGRTCTVLANIDRNILDDMSLLNQMATRSHVPAQAHREGDGPAAEALRCTPMGNVPKPLQIFKTAFAKRIASGLRVVHLAVPSL